jgi:hypothetical protein
MVNFNKIRMKKYLVITVFAIFIASALISCKKYLDVVPDNVATIDYAFNMRSQAQKFLFTCYSYLPGDGDITDDPGMLGGDEIWEMPNKGGYFNMARGLQNKVNPLGDRWLELYRALRDCNIFLENIDRVPDIDPAEKLRWVAEVKFLKAYYHFYLIRMYGPIPLIKVNLPIDAGVNEVKVTRNTVDECFDYVNLLLNEAVNDLPLTVNDPASESGRITQPIALALKAKVLVTAASPLFNGNTDQSTLKNPDGIQLFNQTFSKQKWDSAAIACKKAIDVCHQLGMKLYYYNPSFSQFNLTATIKTQLNIRNSFAEKWNSEIIWANTQTITATTNLQRLAATWWDPALLDGTIVRGELSPPLKIAEMFYTKNGVPISEDKTYNYTGRYTLRKAVDSEKLLIKKDYITATLHFDREPRFYADLGFDGGIWYGQGKYDDSQDLFFLQAKFKERNGYGKIGYGTETGYYIKKYVHFQNVIGTAQNYSSTSYAWPIIRLSDLYLLYSEALNESAGPSAEVYTYIDQVRLRAGLGGVQTSWSNYATNPVKPNSKDGMREIVHQERLNELAFESQRFWDLRRWKEAGDKVNTPVLTWDLMQTAAVDYYRPVVLFNQTFGAKDYFWPIRDGNIEANRNLVQNLGW